MVHIDLSPITVETEYNYENDLSRAVVYMYGERLWESPLKKWWDLPDLEDMKKEWDAYYQAFQQQQFTEWLKTNGPRAQAEE